MRPFPEPSVSYGVGGRQVPLRRKRQGGRHGNHNGGDEHGTTRSGGRRTFDGGAVCGIGVLRREQASDLLRAVGEGILLWGTGIGRGSERRLRLPLVAREQARASRSTKSGCSSGKLESVGCLRDRPYRARQACGARQSGRMSTMQGEGLVAPRADGEAPSRVVGTPQPDAVPTTSDQVCGGKWRVLRRIGRSERQALSAASAGRNAH